MRMVGTRVQVSRCVSVDAFENKCACMSVCVYVCLCVSMCVCE